MNSRLFLSALSCVIISGVTAQVSVSTDGSSPDPSSMLDVKSTDKGVLVPRMTTIQRTGITSPADGLLVYDQTTQTFWYYKNSDWNEITGGGAGWGLTGNAGTDPAINFIGTTDYIPLHFRVNNENAGVLNPIDNNTAFGYQSLSNALSGWCLDNCAIGDYALFSNTMGELNTATGYLSMYSNATGAYNTANGSSALVSNISGHFNAAFGYESLLYHATGDENTAIGSNAMFSHISGNNNSAFGAGALDGNQYGSGNVAVGYFAGSSESGNNRLYIDNQLRGSLQNGREKSLVYGIFDTDPSNQVLAFNAKVGMGTISPSNKLHVVAASDPLRLEGLQTTTNSSVLVVDANGVVSKRTGSFGDPAWSLTGNAGTNPAVNFIGTTDNKSLKFKVNNINSGSIDLVNENTSLGYQTLDNIVPGYGITNTAFGKQALYLDTEGEQNTASGYGSLSLNMTGCNNTAVGIVALYSNNSGNFNTAVGSQALLTNETGNENTALGNNALIGNFSGSINTAVGNEALTANFSGNNNTAVGNNALNSNVSGNSNVAIGNEAGYFETGSNKLYIDNQSRSSETDGRNKALIYGVFDADPANQKITINGKVGIGTSNPENGAALEISSTTKGFLPPRLTKDQRDSITDVVDGLMIFCTDCFSTGTLQIYFGGYWRSLKFSYPLASNVAQNGLNAVGGILTGSYVYSNSDNNPEGTSIYKWYRAENASGLNEIQIEGASALQYQLTSDDLSKYIRFSVTPLEQNSDLPGYEVKSSIYSGPVVSWLCGVPLVDDRDGQSYGTVQIGNQCWMSENLNYGVMLDSCTNQSDNEILEKYCYDNNPANCEIYGGLYCWQEQQMDLCPVGWHTPTWQEFDYFDINAGGAMKEQGTVHWNAPNTGASNSSGFSALPAGYANYNYIMPCMTRTYLSIGTEARFLTANPSDITDPDDPCFNMNIYTIRIYSLNYSSALLGRNCELRYSNDAYSLRCIKD